MTHKEAMAYHQQHGYKIIKEHKFFKEQLTAYVLRKEYVRKTGEASFLIEEEWGQFTAELLEQIAAGKQLTPTNKKEEYFWEKFQVIARVWALLPDWSIENQNVLNKYDFAQKIRLDTLASRLLMGDHVCDILWHEPDLKKYFTLKDVSGVRVANYNTDFGRAGCFIAFDATFETPIGKFITSKEKSSQCPFGNDIFELHFFRGEYSKWHDLECYYPRKAMLDHIKQVCGLTDEDKERMKRGNFERSDFPNTPAGEKAYKNAVREAEILKARRQ